jgi:hypothetical protein
MSDATKLAQNLMLAPWVVAMRMPLLMAEALGSNPWRVETMRATSEKSAAFVEGMVAAQIASAAALGRFSADLMSGKISSIASGQREAAHIVEAALKPAGKAVRKNYRRLSKKRVSVK